MNNTGIILTLAYPDTIVRISEEKLVSYMRFIGIGTKNHVRAGHAALVLIEKATGNLDYFDFGRYTTPQGFGRVRGKETDCELDFNLKVKINSNKIENLNEVTSFFATNPKLTHGEGRMVASTCNTIDYQKARTYIAKMQEKHFIKYAVFTKNASNCARFVTDTLIASVTDSKIKKTLENSKWFTPSTVGNVLLANTEDAVFEVSEVGEIVEFKGSQRGENIRCFLDKLKNYSPTLIGNLKPKHVIGLHKNAQWLSGVGAGAWFELHKTNSDLKYRFKRISPYGNIDIDAVFTVEDETFNYNLEYKFVHYSNCKFFNVEQAGKIFMFERKD